MVIIFLVYAFTAFAYGKNREITFWKIRFKKVSQLLPCTTRLTGLSREHVTQRLLHKRWRYMIIACLSNDDGDGNENGKKAIGLDWQNNNFARASRNFVHFFAVISRFVSLRSRRRKGYGVGDRAPATQATFCGGPEHKTTTLFFFFWSLKFNSRKSRQHLTNWSRWNTRD